MMMEIICLLIVCFPYFKIDAFALTFCAILKSCLRSRGANVCNLPNFGFLIFACPVKRRERDSYPSSTSNL